MTISSTRARPVIEIVAVVSAFVVATVFLRGQSIAEWNILNPDEAELFAEARVAVRSPVPYSTWLTGTNGPYSVLFLAALMGLGAPATLAFAHLLSAVLLALTASAVLFSASSAIGRKAAVVFTLVWWFPIATIFPVGSPVDYGAMSTEYLPVLLIAASALVSRRQLVARPWLFGVVGLLAGIAIGAKYQLGPVALAFAAAQLIVLRPSRKRIIAMSLWWLAGVSLSALALMAIMLVSAATNWTLVEQMLTFLLNYASLSPLDKIKNTGIALLKPALYLLPLLGALFWFGRHSDRSSTAARAVLVASGLVAMVVAGTGMGHYNIALFGAIALAATMPIRSGETVLLKQVSPAVLCGIMAVLGPLCLVFGYAVGAWAPLTPKAALASLSSDSVNRIPVLTRACPPGSPALVWGWAPDVYLVQDWQSTIPYQVAVQLRHLAANKETGEPLVRAGIDRANCVVDATKLKGAFPRVQMSDMVLPEFYPRLAPALREQFHVVPIPEGCDGCILYVRNSPRS